MAPRRVTSNTITGTSQNDYLTGTNDDDIINGGAGSDTMVGGLGNDTYYVDRAGDLVVESENEGIDTVYSSVDYSLTGNVENLTLTGKRAITATGNTLNNIIVGNGIANVLYGGGGDDTLTGAGGNDSINGGDGTDTAVYSRSLSDYAITWTGSTLEIRALAGGDGTDFLAGIEYLRFADQTVSVSAFNRLPVANSDTYLTTSTSVLTGNILANDGDADGQYLTITEIDGQAISFGQPITLASGAVLVVNEDGSYTYDPKTAAGFGDGQTATESFTYTIADTLGGTATATVTIVVEDAGGTPAEPPAYYVQDLLFGDTQRWNYPSAPGTAATVPFTFLDATPGYYSPTHWANTDFRSFSEQQREMTRDALADIAGYANIQFVEVSDVSQAAITFGIAAVATGVGYTYAPSGTGIGIAAGDVWLYSSYAGDSFTLGSNQYKTLIHEIGHAIGLDHPSTLTGEENSRMYTMMSYNHHPSAAADPETPMVYDIAAIQYLYGVNASTRTGDDVYDLAQLNDRVLTIWDSGGNDTLHLAEATDNVHLDLRPGEHSTVAGWGSYNFAIAYGTTIENATGGGGDDILIGNAADNRLEGGQGNDLLTGNAGRDSFVFAASFGHDQITDFTSGEDVIDLRGLGLTLEAVAITHTETDTVISVGTCDVKLVGVTQLGANDILLN